MKTNIQSRNVARSEFWSTRRRCLTGVFGGHSAKNGYPAKLHCRWRHHHKWFVVWLFTFSGRSIPVLGNWQPSFSKWENTLQIDNPIFQRQNTPAIRVLIQVFSDQKVARTCLVPSWDVLSLWRRQRSLGKKWNNNDNDNNNNNNYYYYNNNHSYYFTISSSVQDLRFGYIWVPHCKKKIR